MSGGRQQTLAIGRAPMARLGLVVFDEISLGLAPIVMDRLYEALGALRRAGLAMINVEQDVKRALEIALQGTSSSIRADARLRHLSVGTAD